MKARVHGTRLMLSAGTAVALAIGALAAGPTAFAAGPAPVGLGTAAPFAVLAGSAVTNTGPTTITGDLGISPGAAAAVTGFPPGTVSGATHAADAVALQAQTDLVTAYNAAAGRTPVTAVAGGTLGGLTLVGGVYSGDALALTGTLTLDGQNDPNSVWVFQAASSLITASSSTVAFIRGANPCNVFWQVTSSATLGSGSTFVGTIMAMTSISMADSVTVNGRALARTGVVTLLNDKINNSCSTGGPSASASPAASPTASASPAASPTATLPGAPTNVTATAGNGKATVRFSPPASNGGSPITSYTVTSTPGGRTATGTSSPITVTGLTNGTAYTFTVHATNAVGSGPKSSPSSSVTPTTALPNTATLATTDVPGSGPTPVVFVGILLLAFVVASRLALRPIRTR
jgi:hypothetical protein